MPRIEVDESNPRYEITIGWDTPMQTYFAQVEDRVDPGDDLVFWIGTSFREILDYSVLVPALAPYGTVTAEDLAYLWEETKEELTMEYGELGPAIMFD